MNWLRIKSDINGNPRYVVHFLECCPRSWHDLPDKYNRVVKLMNQVGGRKYNNKQYSGGIVFSFYNQNEQEQAILAKIKEVESN